MRIERAQRPTRHHLPGLFVQVHPVSEPEADKLAQVHLIRKRFRGDRRVVFVARLCIPKEPILRVGSAPAPLAFFQVKTKLKPLPPA